MLSLTKRVMDEYMTSFMAIDSQNESKVVANLEFICDVEVFLTFYNCLIRLVEVMHSLVLTTNVKKRGRCGVVKNLGCT